MEIKAVSKCIHNGFNTEETNFDCPVDPIIPVPPLCRCCLIVKQSFHNTGDLMYVHVMDDVATGAPQKEQASIFCCSPHICLI